MLLRGWDNGVPLHELEHNAQQAPVEMDKIFDALTTGIPDQDRAKSLQLFQWVVLAQIPLGPRAISLALAFSEEVHPSSFSDHIALDMDSIDIERFVLRTTHLSRGLIEFATMKNGKIVAQVIHESVREWFLTSGFVRLDQRLLPYTIARLHLDMVSTCSKIAKSGDFKTIHQDKPLLWSGCAYANDQVESMRLTVRHKIECLELTGYSVDYIFVHARKAEDFGSIPDQMLYDLCLPQSVLFHRLVNASTGNQLHWMSSAHGPLAMICAFLTPASLSWALQNGTAPELRAINHNVVNICMSIKPWSESWAMLDILDATKPLRFIRDRRGQTGLHWACQKFFFYDWGDAEQRNAIKFWLKVGVSIDEQDDEGKST